MEGDNKTFIIWVELSSVILRDHFVSVCIFFYARVLIVYEYSSSGQAFFYKSITRVKGDVFKFSREEEQNSQLLFLDVLVQRHRDGKINTSVYRKSSNSDIVLHYSSDNPTSH